MTAMGDALKGYLTKVELKALAENFIKSGGSREAWILAFDEAAVGMPGEDQHAVVGNDQVDGVPARQPNASAEVKVGLSERTDGVAPPARNPMPDEGQVDRAQQSRHFSAPVRQPDRSERRSSSAQEGQKGNALAPTPIASGKASPIVPVRASSAAPPAREPTQRYLNALAETRRANAKVQLELIKTSNGVVWGSIRPREFAGMIRDGHMAWAIKEAFGPFNAKQESMQLREFLPDTIFKKALTLAEVNRVS